MARIAAECSKFAGDIDTSVQYLELAYYVRGWQVGRVGI